MLSPSPSPRSLHTQGTVEMPGGPRVRSDGSLGEGKWRYSCMTLPVLQVPDGQGHLPAPVQLHAHQPACRWPTCSAPRRVGRRRDARRSCLQGCPPTGQPSGLPAHLATSAQSQPPSCTQGHIPRQVLYEALVDPGWDGGGNGLAALPRISGTRSSSVAAGQRANSRGWLQPGRPGAQTLATARTHHGKDAPRPAPIPEPLGLFRRSGFGPQSAGLPRSDLHAATALGVRRGWSRETHPPGASSSAVGGRNGSLSFRGEPGRGAALLPWQPQQPRLARRGQREAGGPQASPRAGPTRGKSGAPRLSQRNSCTGLLPALAAVPQTASSIQKVGEPGSLPVPPAPASARPGHVSQLPDPATEAATPAAPSPAEHPGAQPTWEARPRRGKSGLGGEVLAPILLAPALCASARAGSPLAGQTGELAWVTIARGWHLTHATMAAAAFGSLSLPHQLVPKRPAEPAPSSPPSPLPPYKAHSCVRGLKCPSRLLRAFRCDSARLGAAPAAGPSLTKCPTTKKRSPPTFGAAALAWALSCVLCPCQAERRSGRENAVCCVEQLLQVNAENSS